MVDVFSSFMFNRFFIGFSEVFTDRQPGDVNPVEIFYQSKLAGLETRVTVLIIALALVSIVAVTIFLLYQKNWKSQSLLMQKNEEIEKQQRSNDEIMQMLEQKKREIEQQSFELYETSTELKWQTENALRLYDEVEQQKQEMTDSIVYAKRIQTVLLPERTFINEILNDYFVLFQPRDIVSGDFYWVSAKTGKTVVAVADCTGHGVPGAFMSIMGITFLNAIVQPDNLHADIILNLLRKQVIKALKQTGKDLENKDGMDMALCIIDWENARIEYAGANIPLILLRSTPTSPDELIEVCADRMPIGIYATATRPFTRHSVPIMSGDSIYMFSDGYCDQFGGEDLKKFKKKNLKKLLSEIHTLSMTEQKKRLKQNLDHWRGDLPQVDDILMLGIKI
ncbi:MAG: SpoIIE family protein phosphatase [Bacteroidales bacterium]|nr:SpoIIE family protein phosphatase [Bacteroidales bacterium]